MPPNIIQTYRKDLLHAPGHGYGRNIGTEDKPVWVAPRAATMSSEVVHTTNNKNKDTKVWNEATYLRDSPDVSCHDFIAKNGDVYVILPETMVAWHAGVALPAFTNAHSFGTELHVSLGEVPTAAQIASLAYRIQQRRTVYGTTKEHIDTHRAVALPGPNIRKHDPEGWADADFYKWRDGLFLPAGIDFSALWGSLVPYFEGSGIAAAWRDNAATLGRATSDETTDKAGTVWRLFSGGAVSYSPMTGKTVVYVPRGSK